MKAPHMSRLAARFTLSSLVAFIAIGATITLVLSGQIRSRQEASAQFHAVFVTDSILRYALTEKDLKQPISTTGTRYAELQSFVRARVLQKPVVGLTVWDPNGRVLFSDNPRLIGQRVRLNDHQLNALAGKTTSELTEVTNAARAQSPGSKLFETYAPVTLASDRSGATPRAVAGVYQDYAGIRSGLSRLFRTIVITMLIGLGALYLVLLPITLPVARTLAEQNRKLEEEARRSEELLRKEHHTVSELRRLNLAQGEFVAVASHELRTPLTSIIGYAKTLRQPQFANDSSARDEFLQAIERQGDRLFQLVENLLTSSHVEDHILRLSISTFSFRDLVRDVVEGLGNRRERVLVALPPDLPTVLSDRQYVAQIIQNLLGNALKFSPPETQCELGARWAGGTMTFWVRDHGIGIPEDEIDRIFDRFYQVDSSTPRPYGGIGLGLSLVRNLVKTLGGTISVNSKPKLGSTFNVTLPLVHPSVGERYGHANDLNR